jgi:hypothetical protein
VNAFTGRSLLDTASFHPCILCTILSPSTLITPACSCTPYPGILIYCGSAGWYHRGRRAWNDNEVPRYLSHGR